MLKRHEVQVLLRAGHSKSDVARRAGLSVSAVKRIEKEAPVSHVDDGAERDQRRIGRPSRAEGLRGWVLEQVKAQPDILTLELMRRARQDQGYTAGKSAFYEMVASVRPEPVRPMVRFEGLAGEFCQHDFGQVKVRFIDGGEKTVHFFASRLKYSRWVEVTVVADERTETVVRCLVNDYTAMGGAPLFGVFDRPSTIVQEWKPNGQPTRWNMTFAAVMLELGVGVDLCWPARGNQKGSVENLVGFVKGNFFKQRRFVDMEDVLTQLKAWVHEVNNARVCRATGETPLARMAAERQRLRPVRLTPESLSLPFPVVAGPTGYVPHDTNLYSMPARAIGVPGTLHLYRDRVRIQAGSFVADHPRLRGGGISTLPAHRVEMVQEVSGRRARTYQQREYLLQLGDISRDYLTELLQRRPNTLNREVAALHELMQQHGDERFKRALQLALAQSQFGSEYVAHHLGTPLLLGQVPDVVALLDRIEAKVSPQEDRHG